MMPPDETFVPEPPTLFDNFRERRTTRQVIYQAKLQGLAAILRFVALLRGKR